MRAAEWKLVTDHEGYTGEGAMQVLPDRGGKSLIHMTISNFFSDGLRFACTDCQRCCTGAPGVVFMSVDEVLALADFLGMTEDAVCEQCLLPHGKGFRIRERPGGDCHFFNERCTIYGVRPSQCRTYPFWFKNLRSVDAWENTVKSCPGIGRGRLYTEDEILSCIHRSHCDRE